LVVVKPDNEERRVAMFKDNKLRLLMTLVGFSRLGDHDDPEASWIISSSLSSADLQEAIDLIRKYEFDPPVYEDGKGPEDLLRSKAAAARRSTRRVDFDDDSDGIDHESAEDLGEYAADGPTARKGDGTARKKLKSRRRARTPVELDDEEKEKRAEARRRKEIEKQKKAKSTVFVHDSDDEEDAEKDAEFFAREEALRSKTNAVIKKTLILGSLESMSSKKRKADETSGKAHKRQRTPPKRKPGPFDTDESEDDDDVAGSASSRAQSADAGAVMDEDSEDDDEATDTPLSSQQAGGAPPKGGVLASAAKTQDVVMVDAGDDEDEDEDMPVFRRPAPRNTRGGFVIDSDSE
jgi:replication fork protection complex subunit Tof1/Swi1